MTIASATLMLERVRSETPRILVGVSGGKDSLVTLDLCVEVFGASNVHAFFMQMVPDLRCEMAPLERSIARYPGLRLTTLPHWALAQFMRYGYLMTAAQKVPALKQKDVEDALRARTGIDWIAGGHRAVESLVRNAMLRAHGMNGHDIAGRRVYPIWDWKGPDVYGYMRLRKIQIPERIAPSGTGKSSGVRITEDCLVWMAEHHPDDFAKVCKVFPLAPTLIARNALRTERA